MSNVSTPFTIFFAAFSRIPQVLHDSLSHFEIPKTTWIRLLTCNIPFRCSSDKCCQSEKAVIGEAVSLAVKGMPFQACTDFLSLSIQLEAKEDENSTHGIIGCLHRIQGNVARSVQ